MSQQPAIYVEYEFPPLRAIYHEWYADDGQTDEEVQALFAEAKERA